MEKKSNYFICEKCKNLVESITDSGKPLSCCGAAMKNLEPTYTPSPEKHTPTVSTSGDTVTVNVGTVEHPMAEEHAISFVSLTTPTGRYRRILVPGGSPRAEFKLTKDELPLAVYAYCNLHGLYKTQLYAPNLRDNITQ